MTQQLNILGKFEITGLTIKELESPKPIKINKIKT